MPRTRSLAWAELKIGILSVAAIAVAVIFAILVGGEGFLPWTRYHLKTRFSNVLGLKPGAVVRLAGVEVGQVSDVQFVGAQVEVVLEISDQYQPKITSESRAMLGSISLLGETAVDITASAAGQMLKNWEYIKSARTPGQLSDVAEGATEGIDEAIGLLRDIRSGRGTVGRLFTDETMYREFTQFIAAAEDVVDKINRGRGTMGRLVTDDAAYKSLQSSLANLDVMTRRITAGEGSLGRLLKDDEFARSLSATTGQIEQMTSRLNRGEGTAGKLLTDEALYKRLDAVVARLDSLARRLDEGEGTAGQLLRDKRLYENMNGAVNDFRSLVTEVRKDPKKYLNVKVSIF
jgi:phospholipid/cholesterol/gamma-HCH transport system substrate-binding protein